MATRRKQPSPVLGAAMALIDEAGGALVTRDSRFRHSFEASVVRIRPDPDQPRKTMAEGEVTALATTMAEQGQLQPVLVRRDPENRGSFILVAGERRWRAAQLNGWETILAIEHEGDPEVAALIENLQRVDLTPVEEARGLQRLIKGKGLTQAQAAELLGRATGEVSATLRILTLPGEVLDQVLTSELEIPRNVLVELARVENPQARTRLIELARQGRLTVRAVRAARDVEAARGDGAGEGILIGDAARPGSSRPRPPARFKLGSLDRIATGLRALREAGGPLRPRDRTRLEVLRQEINALLGGAGE